MLASAVIAGPYVFIASCIFRPITASASCTTIMVTAIASNHGREWSSNGTMLVIASATLRAEAYIAFVWAPPLVETTAATEKPKLVNALATVTTAQVQ